MAEKVEMSSKSIIPFDRGAFEKGDETSRFPRWEKYLRDINLNIQVNNIINERRKLYFLAIAGPYIQELDERLPIYDVTKDTEGAEKQKDSYEQLIWRLNRHFKPKYNEAMEKVLFRQIKQEENEDVEKIKMQIFIRRRRNQDTNNR
jgi:hypothetical protein